MGFIFFGVGFGLLIGAGLFLLVIYPAIKERKLENRQAIAPEKSAAETRSLKHHSSTEKSHDDQ